ncbi:MAG TPA: 23S rRNA (guanosine(2251)-2'-O)-methyltransferase RlmB [Syntrophales bacterium]|nr:23S rRNA (guanosine(2251)-2'-O)-methyltransferase RlmB [Syntrophales bacterium]HOL58910.1 23S rRNA (guanosine(2251)-2'-O)-methyltransferase RlmB [Syntrophales bacterium]HPO35237.1 23S rRNA (guanosine(2251)-2'-O)-methyltransferase RlmB [Syntrophales bacterium]
MPTIYGVNPVREFLKAHSGSLTGIVIARGRGGKEIEEIHRLAEEAGVQVTVRERAYLEKLVGRVAHQGIVGLVAGYGYASLDEVMANRRPGMAGNLVVVADHVTDPHNLGAIIRTAYCLGANGLVIPDRRAAEVTATVVKASAGAAYYLPVAKETNLARALEILKANGFWVYAAEAEAKKELEEMDFPGNVVLIVGGEGQGIRRLLKEKADFLFSIPMIGEINSLNVSVATGIVLYKIFSHLRRMG